MSASRCPFLDPQPMVASNALSILYLRRDQQLPVLPMTQDDGHGETAGTEEKHGNDATAIVNTRFGSFPHSALIGLPWGTQTPAFLHKTGRGRGQKQAKKTTEDSAKIQEPSISPDLAEDGEVDLNERKRKSEAASCITPTSPSKRSKITHPQIVPTTQEDLARPSTDQSSLVLAPSGFAYVLPPTPERWTLALPHRTQVVYTPDYAFVLQRLRVRPGDVLIEAGAGSGSFTHAAARAVFNGWPQSEHKNGTARRKGKMGRVYSFEYHKPRVDQLNQDLHDHGLDDIVAVTHRNVYQDGFRSAAADQEHTVKSSTLQATAVFLDLPNPWLAIPHITRPSEATFGPLATRSAAHICCFLPCIEQVQKTAQSLRSHGWTDVSVIELSQRRLEVRREGRATSVHAIVDRLKEIGGRLRQAGSGYANSHSTAAADVDASFVEDIEARKMSKKEKAEARQRQAAEKEREKLRRRREAKPWREGRVVVRTEPEVKTHTSYLVFGTLSAVWSEEREQRMRRKWGDVASSEDKQHAKGGGEA